MVLSTLFIPPLVALTQLLLSATVMGYMASSIRGSAEKAGGWRVLPIRALEEPGAHNELGDLPFLTARPCPPAHTGSGFNTGIWWGTNILTTASSIPFQRKKLRQRDVK